MENTSTVKSTETNVNSKRRGRGRPRKSVALNSVHGHSFTLDDVFKYNVNLSTLTVRKRVKFLVERGTLTKLTKKHKTGTKGKPADMYMHTSVLNYRLKARMAEMANKATGLPLSKEEKEAAKAVSH